MSLVSDNNSRQKLKNIVLIGFALIVLVCLDVFFMGSWESPTQPTAASDEKAAEPEAEAETEADAGPADATEAFLAAFSNTSWRAADGSTVFVSPKGFIVSTPKGGAPDSLDCSVSSFSAAGAVWTGVWKCGDSEGSFSYSKDAAGNGVLSSSVLTGKDYSLYGGDVKLEK